MYFIWIPETEKYRPGYCVSEVLKKTGCGFVVLGRAGQAFLRGQAVLWLS